MFSMSGWFHRITHKCALQVPQIRRLVEARNALLDERAHLLSQAGAAKGPTESSPFFHYNATFDAVEVIQRHAVSDLKPHPEYFTSFLGVLIAPKFYPSFLGDKAGQIDHIPIPANWHADIAEWAAALRAVELARDKFTMIELGCGWGTWMNSTGVVAKRRGLKVFLIGVEGDKHSVEFAKEASLVNGFGPAEFTVFHGIAAAQPGTALFPRHENPGEGWGSEPMFNADPEVRRKALQSGKFDELRIIPLTEIIDEHPRIDLLHVDIQGGEANLVSDCLSLLNHKAAYMVIGTHSRQIEGRLFETLNEAGWRLEAERPAILSLGKTPQVTVDGVQGWRNPRLLAE